MRLTGTQTLLDAKTPVAITSSTDATPIVVTSTAHGLVTGDYAFIYGHTTNVAANGIFQVTRLTADTFSLQDQFSGSDVAGSGGGAGASGYCMYAPRVMAVPENANVVLQIDTSGTATTTLKVAISLGRTAADTTSRAGCPSFGGTITTANTYSFAQIINLDSGSSIAGSTGIVVAGTDIHNLYEVNVNAVKYFTVIPTSWTAGAISIKALITDNG